MRRFLAAAFFVLLLPVANAMPKGMKIEPAKGGFVLKTEGAVPVRSMRAAALDGTWAAAFKVGDKVHHFSLALAQFPGASGGYSPNFLARQDDAGNGPHSTNGFVWQDGVAFFVSPRWGSDLPLCMMARVGNRYEGECEGLDRKAHLALKRLSSAHPFVFTPVVANASAPSVKEENTGLVYFNSYQSAVQRSYVATIPNTPFVRMSFDIQHETPRTRFGVSGVSNLEAAATDPGFAVIPYFVSTLDGQHATARLIGATKFEKIRANPLLFSLTNEPENLRYVVSEPEN